MSTESGYSLISSERQPTPQLPPRNAISKGVVRVNADISPGTPGEIRVSLSTSRGTWPYHHLKAEQQVQPISLD